MLELPNFGHMTTHLQYSLKHVINFVSDVLDRNYDVINFILSWPRVANFDNIIKFGIMFIKITFKDSKKL